MRQYDWIALAGTALLVVLVVSAFQNSPGYMDADYYFSGGLRLAEGYGFTELVVWNYLDEPAGLPHPSHVYWMPLPSILAALGMAVFSKLDFLAARSGFLLLSLVIAPVSAAVAYRLTQKREAGLLVGLLAALPSFYLPYLPTIDSFGICMLLGGLFFFLMPAPQALEKMPKRLTIALSLGLGLLSGCMHLSRVEGFVWLPASMLVIWSWRRELKLTQRLKAILLPCSFCIIGYLLVMGPWMLRNYTIFGSLFNPFGARALWITEYNEIFSYPVNQLTLENWLRSGWVSIFKARLWALGQNLQTFAAIQGEIFLLPFIITGMWRMRNDYRIRIGASLWAALFLIMTVVFPFQGARGGFFHAGAALQPLFWAVVPIGFFALLEWGTNHRGWNLSQASKVFSGGLVGLTLLLTIMATSKRLASGASGLDYWDASSNRYAEIAKYLDSRNGSSGYTVMVKNAPGFFIASREPAFSIPYTDLEGLCSVAKRYTINYLLLEIDQIKGEKDLYDRPKDRACLHYLGTSGDTRIFGILLE